MLNRIQLFFLCRRADAVIRRAKAIKQERDHLNRPHVPSVHLVGHWIPKPMPTAREMGVTPRYVAGVAILALIVVALNTYFPSAAQPPMFACGQQLARN